MPALIAGTSPPMSRAATGTVMLLPAEIEGALAARLIVAAGEVTLLPAEIAGAFAAIAMVAAGHVIVAPVAAWIVGAMAVIEIVADGTRTLTAA